MLLEVRSVGRKTPNDGKLEITEATARRLAVLPMPRPVRVGDHTGHGSVSEFECTCGKGNSDAPHRHHFLESDLFRELVVDQTVVLELVGESELVLSLPHPI